MDYTQAITCAVLSDEVYQDFSSLSFSPFSQVAPITIEDSKTDTQCAIIPMSDADCAYVVFRGSDKGADWGTNFEMNKQGLDFEQQVLQAAQDHGQTYPYGNATRSSNVQMHEGFVDAYLTVRSTIHQYFKAHPCSIVTVTGHSLGGALATLCALDLQYNFFDSDSVQLYTFGSPRVGNADFSQSFKRRVPHCYRVINGMDVIPAVPRPWQGYRHVDTEYRIGNRFSFRFVSKRIKDHAISRYIQALKKMAVSA